MFATLLGGYSSEGDSTSWMALPLLSGGRKGPDSSDTWIIGPLAHYGRRNDSKTSHLFPLYYSAKSKDSSMFLSLPWMSSKNKDDSWQIVPLFYFGVQSEQGSKSITPLYATGVDADDERWNAVVPLYYRNEKSGTFASSLFVRFNNSDESKTTIIPPLLSWHTRGEGNSDLWMAGPLAHWSWGEKAGQRTYTSAVYSGQMRRKFCVPSI